MNFINIVAKNTDSTAMAERARMVLPIYWINIKRMISLRKYLLGCFFFC